MSTAQIYAISAAILGGSIWLSSRSSSASQRPDPNDVDARRWVDPDAPRRIRAIASGIESAMRWPGLGDFLVATAWRESRGNTNACNGACTSNSARGWFQLRPKSSVLVDQALNLSADDLYNEPVSVAMAAWYAYRLRKWRKPNQVVTWAALSRGWRYPYLVKDVDRQRDGSEANYQRLRAGFRMANVPESRANQAAFSRDFRWLGVSSALTLAFAKAGAS